MRPCENRMTAEAILRKINPRGKPTAADNAIAGWEETPGRVARLKERTSGLRA